jgi:hypothetical protein
MIKFKSAPWGLEITYLEFLKRLHFELGFPKLQVKLYFFENTIHF